eukprot:CAMPEP_0172316994 /NCGR_PEP_ID=MMETSP1058-20130122/30210_1 /TAXON_ID=83371 /ORGANISM="Detonula confervacea, Strain CCMP 353" /LENGTH=224 /DNA_ID=CAMNT_0013031441 /DNA_START=23 /DNA_END=697 /DNA_ORIENTATION=-
MTEDSSDTFHPVGACLLWVDGNLPSAPNKLNLVVSEVNDSYDMDAPAIYDVQPNGMKRYKIGKLKGFLGPRMEARSFWYGLGHRSGIQIVAQALPNNANIESAEGEGTNKTKILIIVKAQVGVFDIREFKQGDRDERDQRPGRALNALLRYCEEVDLPEVCKPFYNAKALKALTKRPLTLKDLGIASTASGSSKAGSDKAKKAEKKAAVSKSKQAKHTKKSAKK